MALAPKFAGQAVLAGSAPTAVHNIELFLDYVCPFSAKMFSTLHSSVFPTLDSKYPNKVRFVVRQQIQPWHPSSTLVHEAAAAVLRVKPDKFIDFSKALFDAQKEYFDVNVVNEARNATYKRLAKLAGSVGVDESKVLGLLEISDKPDKDGGLNTGNGVTDDIKVFTKMNRLQGVHVTPTVLFNVGCEHSLVNFANVEQGVVENSISSSFTGDQWQEWLQKNIV